MHLHEAELINVHWTQSIEREWSRNVIASEPLIAQSIRACMTGMRFPARAFAGSEVRCHDPGAYLDELYEAETATVIRVAEGCRRKLTTPPLSRGLYVAVLVNHGARRLAASLAQKWRVECPVLARNGTLQYESKAVRPKKSPAKKVAVKKGR